MLKGDNFPTPLTCLKDGLAKTAEAVLTGSKVAALQALLVDPVVGSVKAAEQTLETMLNIQGEYLDYLK